LSGRYYHSGLSSAALLALDPDLPWSDPFRRVLDLPKDASMNPNETAPASGALPVPAEIIVHAVGTEYRVPYRAGDTLLEAMRRGGIAAPSLCEQGVCGSCMVRRLKGEVQLRENFILADEDLAAGYTLACQGLPVGEVCEIEIPG
jgi:3-ketosteroid 9alpha-monooxygenase subunit B